MTKEFELFKRWFGLNLKNVILKECLSFKILDNQPEIELVFTEPFCVAENVMPLVNINGFLRMYIQSYYSNVLAFVYEIPTQYHTEWEQHCEQKDKQ